ncbi:hypothetical protein NDU88_005304 [Pleurodeles waltl]|uniref:Uncharacterized protein n=1 Tax=Pleurodeles waltl TaxID=8319 RepID=A0AAV7LP65_PLEWA|nr:hypothetical protein NDU88_005304 [Pleurodeles waltl]
MRRGTAAASEPVRLAQAPAHTASDQGWARGSCVPDGEARRGPAVERAALVSNSGSQLPVAARARLPPPLHSSGRPATARLGRGTVHTDHPSRRVRPQAPQLGCPGVPATATRKSPRGDPGGLLRRHATAAPPTAGEARSCVLRR